MNVCKKCGNEFKTSTIIDGKTRNLGSRRYCLHCSPFGQHNTRRLHKQDPRYVLCQSCGKEFLYDKSAGNSLSFCASCRIKNRNLRIKDNLVAYKGGKCELCGYDKYAQVLEFHHINPEDKLFNIAQHYNIAYSKLVLEVDKCILLCANCHREQHLSRAIGVVANTSR